MGGRRRLLLLLVRVGEGAGTGDMTESESDMVMISGKGFFLLAKVKGRTCREQTRRVVIPEARRRAQNIWAPRSREPASVEAARIKSSFDISSVPGGGFHWEIFSIERY